MMNSSSSISRRASLKQMGMAAAGAGLGLGFASAAETVPAASGKKLRVALVNGSPHEHGCTYTALKEVAGALEGCGVETEIFWIGSHPVAGCIACGECRKTGKCFRNDCVNLFLEKVPGCDGFVFGSPVHFASAAGDMSSFLDRVFYAASARFRGKPGAAVTSCRRAGSTATLDQLNKYLLFSSMPIVSSQYWNMFHGNTPDEVRKDLEGLQIMRTLGRNMAWLLKSIEAGKLAGVPLPEEEPRVGTNFIR